jgi:hypothetical protein
MITELPEFERVFGKIGLKCLIAYGYIKMDYYYSSGSTSAFAALGQLAILVISSALFAIENHRKKSTNTLEEFIVK